MKLKNGIYSLPGLLVGYDKEFRIAYICFRSKLNSEKIFTVGKTSQVAGWRVIDNCTISVETVHEISILLGLKKPVNESQILDELFLGREAPALPKGYSGKGIYLVYDSSSGTCFYVGRETREDGDLKGRLVNHASFTDFGRFDWQNLRSHPGKFKRGEKTGRRFRFIRLNKRGLEIERAEGVLVAILGTFENVELHSHVVFKKGHERKAGEIFSSPLKLGKLAKAQKDA